MKYLVRLILILFSPLAIAATSGSFDTDDAPAPAKVTAPAVKPAAKPEVKPATKPAAKPDDDDDDDDDDDEEEVRPAPVQKRRDDGKLSPSREKARGGSMEDRDAEGTYCKYCSRATEEKRLTIRYQSITAPRDVLNSRIWGTFKRNFEECAPGCQPIGMSSYRDPHARPKPSCHHQNAAIDVFGMRCGGSTYTASRETSYRHGPGGRFTDTVRCMKRKGMYLIYNQADHYDHAHLSLSCNIGGWRYY